jgi:hypothetical protein
MNQVPLDQLTYARFSALVKTRFRVQADPVNLIELELAEAREISARSRSNSEGATLTNECFALTFNGPASRFLEQKMYPFEHDDLGAFSLFVVPVGRTQDAFQYEVIFNRLK